LRDIEQWDDGATAMAVGASGRVFELSPITHAFEQIDDDSGFPAGITGAFNDVEVLDDGASIRIASDYGDVLFRDGTTWTRVRSQTGAPIDKLSFLAPDLGFAVGRQFFISRYDE
jgi:hypothetical protein